MWKIFILIMLIVGGLLGGAIYLGEEVETWIVSGEIKDLDFENASYRTEPMTTVYFESGKVLLIKGEQLEDLIIGKSFSFSFGRNRLGEIYLKSYKMIN